MKATWYKAKTTADCKGEDLRSGVGFDCLLASVFPTDHLQQPVKYGRWMWTTFGPNSANGFENSAEDAKAAAITALVTRELEQ